MKKLFLAITLIFSTALYAQVAELKENPFVRIYDLQGKKIAKGRIISISDTTLKLKRRKGPFEIIVKNIGFIRTKHSAGNNVLIGAASGATFFAIVGIGSADSDGGYVIGGWTESEGAAGGVIVGTPLGAVAGAITILFKNSKKYIIDGEDSKWQTFKQIITGLKQ